MRSILNWIEVFNDFNIDKIFNWEYLISSDNSEGKEFFAYIRKCLLVPIAIRDCVALIAIFCN